MLLLCLFVCVTVTLYTKDSELLLHRCYPEIINLITSNLEIQAIICFMMFITWDAANMASV